MVARSRDREFGTNRTRPSYVQAFNNVAVGIFIMFTWIEGDVLGSRGSLYAATHVEHAMQNAVR